MFLEREKIMTQSARLMYASTSADKDILWLTKFQAPDAFIALMHERKKIAVLNRLEYNRGKEQAEVDELICSNDFYVSDEQSPSISEIILRLLRRYDLQEVTASPKFFAAIYRHLVENGITVNFANPLFPERAIKTVQEIEYIANTQNAMEKAFAGLVVILSESEIRHDGLVWHQDTLLTSEKLKLIFERELLESDCTCEATIIASGEQTTDPHCDGSGPLLANTPIVFDLFPRSKKTGYWSDMSRTVCKGKLTPQARNIYHVVREAQKLGLSMVRPGQYGHEIHAAIVSYFDERGFMTKRVNDKWEGFIHNTGHGVGLDIHESPSIGTKMDELLVPGNVITIEPGLYYPGVGGVRIEDTVVVTRDGYRNLAKCPKNLLEIE